jgi:hypothetical protein
MHQIYTLHLAAGRRSTPARGEYRLRPFHAKPSGVGMRGRHSVPRIAVVLVFIATVLACNSDSAPDPNVPQLVTPVSGAVLDNGCVPGVDSVVWDFDWADVPGATQYQLYVRNGTSVFAMINDSTLTQSSFHFSQSTYTPNTTDWVWWVRARVGGTFHDWAGPRDFSVEEPNTDCP